MRLFLFFLFFGRCMRLFLKIGYEKNAYIIIVYKLNPIFMGKYKFMSLFLYTIGIKLLYTCFDVKIHNFSFSNIKQVLLLS